MTKTSIRLKNAWPVLAGTIMVHSVYWIQSLPLWWQWGHSLREKMEEQREGQELRPCCFWMHWKTAFFCIPEHKRSDYVQVLKVVNLPVVQEVQSSPIADRPLTDSPTEKVQFLSPILSVMSIYLKCWRMISIRIQIVPFNLQRTTWVRWPHLASLEDSLHCFWPKIYTARIC